MNDQPQAAFTPAHGNQIVVCRLCGALVPTPWKATHSNAHALGMAATVEQMTEVEDA